MALALMSIGEKRKVTKLQDLGFAPGSEVQVLGENAAGMILLVKGVRIALDRGLAGKILVA